MTQTSTPLLNRAIAAPTPVSVVGLKKQGKSDLTRPSSLRKVTATSTCDDDVDDSPDKPDPDKGACGKPPLIKKTVAALSSDNKNHQSQKKYASESLPLSRPTTPGLSKLAQQTQHVRSVSASSEKTTSSSVATVYASTPLSYDQQSIKVAVRLRNTNDSGGKTCSNSRPATPNITSENNNNQSPPICMNLSGNNKIDICDPKNESSTKAFHFDTVFKMDASQEDVYNTAVDPLIRKCLEGYNGCIFAYGQTASGKTHTMQGPTARIEESLNDGCTNLSPEVGIITRVVHQLHDHVKHKRGKIDEATGNCLDFVVKVSYLEIYNEGLVDLLVDKDKQEPESITGKDLYVQNLTEKYISTLQDYVRILTTGAKNRSIGETNMNRQSSRSHAILTITIDQYVVEPRRPQTATSSSSITDLAFGRQESASSLMIPAHVQKEQEHSPEVLQKVGQGRKRSKIHLIDLAGSERVDSTGATGDRLKEGSQINQSLSALGNVISALTSPTKTAKQHIPYRDSKLTYLLSDSLGGNALTLMITCCSPTAKNYSESLSTLRFAERVKKVINKAVVNMDPFLLR
ncbi:P-loop containing nucleoside triphosphate hydrolase protein [Obelidium mucronatum]|nr:P-loop containing nucleoside triphosphate hydrolase protein [Obelidium mucronatum]